MEFRRHSFRDERRRRVLTEEAGYTTDPAPAAESAARPRGSAGSGPTYSEAVRAPGQRRVIDLVPTRRWTLLVLTLLATSAATGLLTLYVHLAGSDGPVTLTQVPAADLAAPGNVAQWLASALLLIAAALGLVIYLIRRHRIDDYRGRYRMWYWMVPLLVLASVDHVAHLQGSALSLLITLAGVADPVRAAWVWTASIALLTGVVALRLAAEMSRSRVAVLVLVAAVLCRGAGIAVHHGWFLHATGVFLVVYQAGAVLMSNILLLLALGVYARYVYRDAHGEITAPVRKPRRAKQDVSAPSRTRAAKRAPAAAGAQPASTTTRVDPPHRSVASPAPSRTAAAATRPTAAGPEKRRAAPPAAVETRDADPEEATLSRAERRRLRKLQRRGQLPT